MSHADVCQTAADEHNLSGLAVGSSSVKINRFPGDRREAVGPEAGLEEVKKGEATFLVPGGHGTGAGAGPILQLGSVAGHRTAPVEHGAVLGDEPSLVAGRVQDQLQHAMDAGEAALAVRFGGGEAQ